MNLERDLVDAHHDHRYGTAHRSWPSPVRRNPRIDESQLSRYTQVELCARDIGYREGERAGVRFGWYWGLTSGAIIGSIVTAAAIVAWVLWRYPALPGVMA